jgi:hypothetical protein
VSFWIPWAVDLVIASVFVYFFFVGLADGSVSSFNMGLWLAILCALGGILGGALALRGTGRTRAATVLATIFAIPGALVGLLYLALLATPARWW